MGSMMNSGIQPTPAKCTNGVENESISCRRCLLATTISKDGESLSREALGWCTAVIGGGTPNIQKNIIAERILGLPHD